MISMAEAREIGRKAAEAAGKLDLGCEFRASVSGGAVTGPGKMTVRLEFVFPDRENGSLAGMADERFARMLFSGRESLPERIIGAAVTVNGKPGRITGVNAKAPKFPLIVNLGGTSYRAMPQTVEFAGTSQGGSDR